MQIRKYGRLLAASIASLSIIGGLAQPIGQWNFENGNLTGTAGGPLSYSDGPGALTEQGTRFGTTTSFGIPDIGGTAAKVMKFPAATNEVMGYVMPVTGNATDGGDLMNSYTLIFDLLFPAESTGKWRALFEADNRFLEADAEFFVNPANGIGVSGNYSGTVQSNTWYRIGLVVDGAQKKLRKYIDGVLVGTQSFPRLDDRFALTPNSIAVLFTDNDAESATGYVNSIQLREGALSNGQMRAIAGPSATGIPAQIPPIPSGIERFIPTGEFASRATTVGGVIAPGDTTVQDSSISVALNGAAITNPTITRESGLITVRSAAQNLSPGTKYTNVVTYTDSMAGKKSFTKQSLPPPSSSKTSTRLRSDPTWMKELPARMSGPTYRLLAGPSITPTWPGSIPPMMTVTVSGMEMV